MDNINYGYEAYKNCYALLSLRGFSPSKGNEIVPEDRFEEKMESMTTSKGWIKFERNRDSNYPSPKILLGIVQGDIAMTESNLIEGYVLDEKRKNRAGRAHVIIMYMGKLQSQAKKSLSQFSVPNITRREMNNYANPIVELFQVLEMQLNPLKFKLQPKMKLLTEQEKEHLLFSLLSPIKEKNKTLEELLPIITIEGPICKWYGAFINDVFFFHRTIEGEQSYYRIVRPSPPKTKKTGKTKQKAE